jgi:uncharacterized coiled-coil protein SlyX
MLDKADERAILAEHGRWISRLRDASHLVDQRLTMLERRVSTLERHLAELAKMGYGLEVKLASSINRLVELSSKVDDVFEHLDVPRKFHKNR